ncbi:Crp/Fnr family transcriptional regulator [uncultured Tenacibaculum sp.]|uniref:Crp/Fnr family transcriptional regulator n=1 Tax=uncultured Tenacibaculum sp. TaxID=174713 RepID=UPI002639AC25|nr:Crp/Fnr family transcriptional regulator [uncultured Tenacibaculum sp.]
MIDQKMNNSSADFINFINNYISLSDEASEAIVDRIEYLTLEKGENLVSEGKTCKELYFIISGAVRTFFYKNGKDITHWIYTGGIFTSWHSYLSQTPSKDYLETTEATEIVAITYDKWQDLYKLYPELERFGRLLVEEQMALIDDFYKGYYFLSAKEKYDLLISAIPNITQIANLGHIASMLGISQETLSRIRK